MRYHPAFDLGDDVLVFAHVPKTAGTTVSSWIERRVGADRSILLYKQTLDEFPPELRATCRFLSGHVQWGVHHRLDRDAHYVTVVRDPLDRAVSLYFHLKRHKAHPLNWIAERYAIDDFFRALNEDLDPVVRNQLCNVHCRHLVGTGSDLGGRSPSDVLAEAKRNVDDGILLACGSGQVADFARLLGPLLGGEGELTERMNVGRNRPADVDVSAGARRYFEEAEALDYEVVEHVERRFAELRAAFG